MIVPVMAISNLVLTQQIYSEETNGAHAHYREPVPLSTGTNILTFCTERQTCKTHVLDATWWHQDNGLSVRNMSPLWKFTSCSVRRVSDLKVPSIFTARDEDIIFLVKGKILVFHQYLYNKCDFFAYFKFHSDWGRVIGKIKQNELECRDTAPLKTDFVGISLITLNDDWNQ